MVEEEAEIAVYNACGITNVYVCYATVCMHAVGFAPGFGEGFVLGFVDLGYCLVFVCGLYLWL